MSLVVGIDLGTTNSCVALYRNNKIEILEYDTHKRTTPSFVFYADNGVIVGVDAVNRSAIKPENGIFDIKRLIGRKFDDPQVQRQMKNWPFEIIKEHRDEPLIKINQNGQPRELRPEEVCAEILKKLKKDASLKLEQNIEDVVVTVPAYFTQPQKKATEDAAKIAGLNVLQLLVEPTAAAIAFAQEMKDVNNRTILVYDLGGGTFDVSIVKFKNNDTTVLAVGGNSNLGGRDFDNNLMQYFLEKIGEKYSYGIVEQKPSTLRRSLRRLRFKCEMVKIELSEMQTATLDLDEFSGIEINLEITREDFESLNEHFFKQSIEIVDNVLKRTKKGKKDMDEVILVGGSTKIPRIRQLLEEYFKGIPLNKRLNPDEAVARGAAMVASYLSKNPQQRDVTWTVTDVTPFPLGIEVAGGTMNEIIQKNCTIPALGFKKYKTYKDYQTQVDLRIYEGQNKYVKDNTLLGELTIKGLTPMKKGKVEIVVQLHVDRNGILNVDASETSNKITKTLEVDLQNARLTAEEISKFGQSE